MHNARNPLLYGSVKQKIPLKALSRQLNLHFCQIFLRFLNCLEFTECYDIEVECLEPELRKAKILEHRRSPSLLQNISLSGNLSAILITTKKDQLCSCHTPYNIQALAYSSCANVPCDLPSKTYPNSLKH